jgi:alpha-glucosidase (family GH31 glycosyl hydrolase)
MEFPADTSVYAEEGVYMVGSALLVAPVVRQGANSVAVVFPGTQSWYDIETLKVRSHPSPFTRTCCLSRYPTPPSNYMEL